MRNYAARPGRLRESLAVATLVLALASVLGQGAFAQVQAPTAPGVQSATGSAQDIRDIRGPKPIPSAWLIPLIAISTLLSAAAMWAAWAWYRRRSGRILQTPADIALARLAYARGLMRTELGRDFSIEVSSTVREYIERRFGILAAHLTTDEFLHDLLTSVDPVLAANQARLAEFLESCDLAKFGGWNLSIQDMEAMLQNAQRFIVDTVAATAPMTNLPTPAAAARKVAVIPRETYDSVPST